MRRGNDRTIDFGVSSKTMYRCVLSQSSYFVYGWKTTFFIVLLKTTIILFSIHSLLLFISKIFTLNHQILGVQLKLH